MELITFESKAYQELLKKIERIAEYISKVETPVPDEKKEVWLDSGKSSVRCPLKPSDSIPLCPNNPAH